MYSELAESANKAVSYFHEVGKSMEFSLPSNISGYINVSSMPPSPANPPTQTSNTTNHYNITIDAKNVKDFTDIVKIFDGYVHNSTVTQGV